MRVPDRCVADLRDRGYLIFEGFLEADELAAAQDALWLHYPRPDGYFANHSLVVPKRSQPGTQMLNWILLSDVGDEDGPTKVVPLPVGERVPYWPVPGGHDITNDYLPSGMFAEEEVSMTGPAGTLFTF